MTQRRSFVVSPGDEGLRLDQCLSQRLPDVSRRKARALIEQGSVFLDRRRVKVASRVVRPGQTITLESLTPIAALTDSLDVEPLIVHEDDSLLILNKPSGLLSAPTPESDRNNLLHAAAQRSPSGLWLVHRLDRPTSGLIVFAKTKHAAGALGQALQDHTLRREYAAIVLGHLEAPSVRAELSIEGRAAATEFSTLERRGALSLVMARLETGRTHQVRIHAEALGCPVVGDRRHGGARLARAAHPRPPRLLLHAAALRLSHPQTGAPLELDVPLPDDMHAYWQQLGAQP